jgi:hypothetical protein
MDRAEPADRRRLRHVIRAAGHHDIVAFDDSRIVITRDSVVFDDSVIAVAADSSAAELPGELKIALRQGRKKLTVKIEAGLESDEIVARGSYKLKFTDRRNIVLARQDFADPATIGVSANKSARNLSRELTAALRVPGQPVKITLSVLA